MSNIYKESDQYSLKPWLKQTKKAIEVLCYFSYWEYRLVILVLDFFANLAFLKLLSFWEEDDDFYYIYNVALSYSNKQLHFTSLFLIVNNGIAFLKNFSLLSFSERQVGHLDGGSENIS